MANIVLSAKSANDWSENELRAFNIRVDTVDAPTFFGVDPLPEPNVPLDILENQVRPPGTVSKAVRLFFSLMDVAKTGEKLHVEAFASHLLSLFQYDEPDRLILQNKELPFWMCGQTVYAKPDVVVMVEKKDDYLLVVQEDKQGLHGYDPEPKLIAEAIAAFYLNNLKRRLASRPVFEVKNFPGIIMIGVTPIFYQIPVTRDLVQAIHQGYCPAEPTVVQMCIPPVPEPIYYEVQGIVPIENRRVVMQCFEAFKRFVT